MSDCNYDGRCERCTPLYIDGGRNNVGTCKCGRVVNSVMKFCPKCGQRIEFKREGEDEP